MGETSAKFSFSRVFPPSSSQMEVYLHSTQPLVDEAFSKGQNALIFAYGQTNSGKTYTMSGKDGEEQGIIPRVIHAVIDRLNGSPVEGSINPVEAAIAATSSNPLLSPTSTAPVIRPSKLTLLVSFLEIYNEKVLDLLSKDRRVKCDIQSTAGDEDVFVKGLREVEVHTVEEAFSCLRQGQATRQKAKTALNADSSRSHSVFCIKLLDEDSGRVWSRMSIVDLAGSERTNRTKTESGDERRKEASNINNSLVTLGRCLEILRNQSKKRGGGGGGGGKELIPFRDSALTRLFKDSLTGSGRTVMMVNVSQVHADYDETLHALKYASIAKEVQLVAKVDSRHDVAALKRAHKAKKDQKLKEMEERKKENKGREEEEEEEEEDEEEEEEGNGEEERGTRDTVDVGPDDVDPLNDEMGPVRLHVGGVLVDDREDEMIDEIFRLKQQIVQLQAEVSLSEQRMRDEFTHLMDREAQDSEQLSNRRVQEERERVTALMNKKFDNRLRSSEQQRKDFLHQIQQLEQQLHLQRQQLQEAVQATEKEMERNGELQREGQRLREQRLKEEAEVQDLQAELAQVKESFHSVQTELAVIKVAFEEEKAVLLQKVNESTASLISLQGEMEQERAERAKSEKKERKEAEEKERQREKEVKAERKEAEKARKDLEKEKTRLIKEVEHLKGEAEEERHRLREERQDEQRRTAEERSKVEAAFEEERARWRAEEEQHCRAVEKVGVDATNARSQHEKAMAAVTSDVEQRLKTADEARKTEVAECTLRIDRLTEKVNELVQAKGVAEATRDAAVAAKENLEAKSKEEEERRTEEAKRKSGEVETLELKAAKLTEELTQLEVLRMDYSNRHHQLLPIPQFLQLVRSLLFPSPPTANCTPSIASSPPSLPISSSASLSTVAAVSVSTFKAPPILPAGASTATTEPPPSSASVPKAGILKKTPAVPKVNQRDSMDRWVEGFDEPLVQATLSHPTGNATPLSSSSSSSLVKRGKDRLSSALDLLRFNGHRTAPASSLHHALNEPRSISLVSASPPTTAQTAKGSVANDGGLLSPKVQKVLSRSNAAGKRRSRSKSRRGKENSDDGEGGGGGDTTGEDSHQPHPLSTAVSMKTTKKAVGNIPMNPTFHATLPSPLPSSSTSAQFDRQTAAQGTSTKYSRIVPPLPPAPTHTEGGKQQTPPTSQPTPVAKRTRQHTHSK